MSNRRAILNSIILIAVVCALIIYAYPKLAYEVRCWALVKQNYVDVSDWQAPKMIMKIGGKTTIVGFVKLKGEQFEYSCTVERFQVVELKVVDNAILRAWANGEE